MDQLFADLGLAPDLTRAVEDSGYTEPTPVQSQAIPMILEGRDVLAGAQTGTGKTAGFALPLLQRLTETEPANPAEPGTTNAVRALIVTPTRELAAQVEESVRTYGKYLPLKSAVVYGGVGIGPQIEELKGGVDVLVATPGRLLDHATEGNIDLSHVEIFVLDEADRMLDMGFINDVKRIIALLPPERQSLLFSATFTDDIRELASTFLRDPAQVEVARRNAESELVAQRVHTVPHERKRALLTHLIKAGNWRQVLVFTRTKHGANRLAHQLGRGRISATAIHGNKGQGARIKALDDFKAGQIRVLVATDLAARGLDIAELPHVVNFDLPHVAEDYVHRIGRTGRAGAEGEAISLVTPEDEPLLAEIEKLLGRKLDSSVVPGFEPGSVPPHLLRQQQQGKQRAEGDDVEDGADEGAADGADEGDNDALEGAAPEGGEATGGARNPQREDGRQGRGRGRRGRGRGENGAGMQGTSTGEAAVATDAAGVPQSQETQQAPGNQGTQVTPGDRQQRGDRNSNRNNDRNNDRNNRDNRGNNDNRGNRQQQNNNRRARNGEDHDNRGNRELKPQRKAVVRDDDWGNRATPPKQGRRPTWLKPNGEIDEAMEDIGNRLPPQRQHADQGEEAEINYNVALPEDMSLDANGEYDDSGEAQPMSNATQMFPSSAGFMEDAQRKRRGRGRSGNRGNARNAGNRGERGRRGERGERSNRDGRGARGGRGNQSGQGASGNQGNRDNAGREGNQQREHRRRGKPGQRGQQGQQGQQGQRGQQRQGGQPDAQGNRGGNNAGGNGGGNNAGGQGRRRRRGRGRSDGANGGNNTNAGNRTDRVEGQAAPEQDGT